MNTVNSETIRGDLDRIMELAARVEDWPEILPHYREVRVIGFDERQLPIDKSNQISGGDAGADEAASLRSSAVPDASRLVLMHCVRRFGPVNWPCRWRAKQEVRRKEGKILFHHLAGPCRGMDVEWRFTQAAGGVRTEIHHWLTHPLGKLYSDGVIGPLFVEAIAAETLRTIKEIVEGER